MSSPQAGRAEDGPQSIDQYIVAQEAAVQPFLREVAATIRAAAPDATEKMSWGMPTFWQGENLVHFAAHKRHMGFYPGGEAVGVFADRLTGHRTTKGAIQFPYDQPADHKLIADITRWRVDQAEAKRAR
jgi:uncharacterized protein YdhG (YjbR/CyaY superfamily)